MVKHSKIPRKTLPVKSSSAQGARKTGRETLMLWDALKEVGGFRIFG